MKNTLNIRNVLLIINLFLVATTPFDTFLSTIYIVKSVIIWFFMIVIVASLYRESRRS